MEVLNIPSRILAKIKQNKALSFVIMLVIANYGSIPFYWHARLHYYIFRYRLMHLIGSPSHKLLATVNPFTIFTQTARVWFFDADLNMHMSNSCYSKNFDYSRMELGTSYLGKVYVTENVKLAYGSSSFTFHREIPIFAKYERRTRIVAWDRKWIYMATFYVLPPGQKGNKTGKDLLCCTALGKYVWKYRNGKTLPAPEGLVKVGFGDKSLVQDGDYSKALAAFEEERAKGLEIISGYIDERIKELAAYANLH